MAEWSKAPDSSLELPRLGDSGLRMEAWVRIPLLTHTFFSHLLISKTKYIEKSNMRM